MTFLIWLFGLLNKENIEFGIKVFQKSSEKKWGSKHLKFTVAVKKANAEKALLLKSVIADWMLASGYSIKKTESFKITFTELVAYAFKHGCNENGKIKILINCNAAYVLMEIYNKKGIFLYIDLAQYTVRPEGNSRDNSGRGLLMAIDEADEIGLLPPFGIRAIIEREEVKIEWESVSLTSNFKITRIKVLDGLDSKRFAREFRSHIITEKTNSFEYYIVDIRAWESASPEVDKLNSVIHEPAREYNSRISRGSSEHVIRTPASGSIRKFTELSDGVSKKYKILDVKDDQGIILSNNRRLVRYYGDEIVENDLGVIGNRIYTQWLIYRENEDEFGNAVNKDIKNDIDKIVRLLVVKLST